MFWLCNNALITYIIISQGQVAHFQVFPFWEKLSGTYGVDEPNDLNGYVS